MKPFPTGISVCLSVSMMILAASCVKSASPTSPGGGSGSSNPSNSSYLSSIKNNSQLLSLVDSFTYDNSNRLTKITIIGTDSFSDHSGGEPNVTFSYSGSGTTPASYTIDRKSVV